jgi:DNA-binding transcriptional ArsR family regulator
LIPVYNPLSLVYPKTKNMSTLVSLAPLSHENTIDETGMIPEVNYYNIMKSSLVLRALNHKLREQIIAIIQESKKLTVTQLYVKMRLEQSVISQHLAILRKAGIVSTERDGKFIYYSINFARLADINKFAKDLVG